VATVVVMAAGGAVLVSLLSGGMDVLNAEFILSPPRDMGLTGGINSVLYATLLALGICLAVVLPIGTMSALFLVLYRNKYKRLNRTLGVLLDILSGTPSVVYGMFGLVFFAETLGFGVSIVTGALTLTVMIMPFYVRSLESTLDVFMPGLLRISQSAGMSLASCLLQLVIPSSLSAILMTAVLSSGRALAETAAVLFTAGYVLRMPASVWDPGRLISVHIFELSLNVPGGDARAQASALVLLGALFAIHAVAHALQKRCERLVHDVHA
jgi:phosphate transport system permease protein